jgi:hypothetical protein
MKSINKSILNTLLFYAFFIVLFSCNNNCQSSNKKTKNQLFNPDELEKIDGIYTLKNDDLELEIRINKNYWSGKTMIITGAGDAYDKENIQYDNGIIKDNDLYEKAGFLKMGNVDGNNLTTSIGGQKVLLNKIDL